MTIAILTTVYFAFCLVTNVMFLKICSNVFTATRFGKASLYVTALLNSVVLSAIVYGFNQAPTIVYLLVLLGSIIELSLLFKNSFWGILMYSFLATIYFVCIESITVASSALFSGTTISYIVHDHFALHFNIDLAWLVCMLIAISVCYFVPSRFLKIINQSKEQTLFVLGFLLVALIYLTVNSFIYGYADTFDPVYLPLHQLIAPLTWLLVVTLALILLIRFDYLHGYKDKSDQLQQTVEQQQSELLRIKNKAERDPLVDVYNKIAAETKIQQTLEQVETGALFIFDIDDFKRINDTKGHPFGDKVLVFLAKRITGIFREGDIIGRLGGDEFVIFVKNVSDLTLIEHKAAALCRDINIPFSVEKQERVHITISISIGIAMAPQHGQDFKTLYEHADKALYQSKRSGKNTYTIYHT